MFQNATDYAQQKNRRDSKGFPAAQLHLYKNGHDEQ
jgi:hypothetical protein